MPRGGKREGTGPKPTGRKKRQLYVTDDEYTKVREYIKELRRKKDASNNSPGKFSDNPIG